MASTEAELRASKKWHAKNKQRVKITQTAWYAKRPGYNAAKSNAYYRGQQELLAGSKRPRQCQICKKAGKICFEHDRTDMYFRGWACLNCNFVLGHVNDSVSTLRKLAEYLCNPPSCIKLPSSVFSAYRLRKLIGLAPKKCFICGSTKRICADHCHKKNVFRGWLCYGCNAALGHAHDNPKVLRALADYLDNDKQKQKELKKNAKTKK